MTTGHRFGFHFTSSGTGWNRRWVRYWLASSVTWVTLALVLPVRWSMFILWLSTFVVLFLFPELWSVFQRDPVFPPLTQTIRHFLPNDAAFPLLWGLPGAAFARGLGVLPWWRILFVGVGTALLGWFTIHFTVVYARPDPHPHPGSRPQPPVGEEPPPVIADPRPI